MGKGMREVQMVIAMQPSSAYRVPGEGYLVGVLVL